MTEHLNRLIHEIHRAAGGTPPAPPEPSPPGPPLPRGRRAPWVLLGVVLVAGLVTASVLLVESQRGGDGSRGEAGGWTSEQRVVAWAVWDPREEEVGLAVVLGDGGGRPPVAVAIPGYTAASVPGFGLTTMGEALDLRNPEVAASAVENLLGVRVDAWAGASLVDVASAIDALGGVEVEERSVNGEAFLRYIRRTVGDENTEGELRFIRWLEVLNGMLAAAPDHPGALAELPEEVATGLRAAAGSDVVSFPVESIGSGLVRPVPELVARLVDERFVSTAETQVRLVVLNGNGIPGVGGQVAGILVPEGFRLVTSGNAPTFDVEETQIVAGEEAHLEEAEMARDLLGVGEVLLGEMPTGVADVTVIVGRDFGGS